jgi:ABC-type antimicrobial peptide transport system permease subunit
MLKYTLKNIMRVPFASIVLFLIVTFLFTGFMVTFSVARSAKQNMEDVRIEMGGRVNLEVDMESFINELIKYQEGSTTTQPSMKRLEWSQIEYILRSEYVQDYNVTIEGAGKSPIKHVTLESTEESNENNPDFRLIGDTRLEYNSDFYYKEKYLVEGRGYTEEEVENKAQVAILDRRLADLNQLKIGDVIEFTSVEGVDMNLEIIGIYEDTIEDTGAIPVSYMVRANAIYVPYTTAMESRGDASYKDLITETAFFLKDPLKIEEFKNKLYRTTMQFKGYLLNADDSIYEKKVLPLIFTRLMIQQPAIIISIIGFALSVVFILFASFGRKKTAAALKVMGYREKRIFEMLFTDIALIVVFSFVLSLILSFIFIQPVAENVILSTRNAVDNTIAKLIQNAAENTYMGGGILDSLDVEPIYEISAGLKPSAALIALCMVLALSVLQFGMCRWAIHTGDPMIIKNNHE